MQGPIAQIIALTIWGNAYLSGAIHLETSKFYPTNSAFVFCKEVKFVDLERADDKWIEKPFASDPTDWLHNLKSNEYVALRAHHIPSDNSDLSDRMSVGFVGGGGRWLIEAIGSNGSDYWEARWDFGDQNDPEKKIWLVTYGRIASNKPLANIEKLDLEDIDRRLRNNLTQISKFAYKNKVEYFGKCFDEGLQALSSDNPLLNTYHPDISPKDFLSIQSCHLLGATQRAWVFGGMGSWNDLGFEGEDQKTYDKLSEELFQLLNVSLVASANTSVNIKLPINNKPWWKFW